MRGVVGLSLILVSLLLKTNRYKTKLKNQFLPKAYSTDHPN